MPRRTTFQVDAATVQGNAGATVTFRCLLVGEYWEYRNTDGTSDTDMLKAHLVSWAGIVDDEGHELPGTPEMVDRLYMHEQRALMALFWAGPEGPSSKN